MMIFPSSCCLGGCHNDIHNMGLSFAGMTECEGIQKLLTLIRQGGTQWHKIGRSGVGCVKEAHQ